MARKRKAKNELTASVETITPEIAREYLESGVEYQRSLSRRRVESLALAILAGDWVLSGQPIIFNDKGEMIDGQHRCAAVIQADAPIDTLVVEGVESVAFPTLDIGAKRSASDVLKISGYENVTQMAAVVRCIISWRRMGEFHMREHSVYPSEILEFVRQNEHNLINLVKFYQGHIPYMRAISIGSALPAMHWILRDKRVPVGLIEEFVDKLLFGENLKKADPIYQFRDALIYSAQHPTHRMQLRTKTARLVKTWNAFRLGNVGPQETRWNPLNDDYPELVTSVK